MSARTEDKELRAKLFGPTIDPVTGKIQACSCSQVKTHKLCPLKWYHDKVLKLERSEAKSAGAQESTEAHDRMEVWLETGGDVRNEVERHGEEMISDVLWTAPFNKGIMEVEGPLVNPELRTPGGVKITGFFDVFVPFPDLPLVHDHKFLKNVDKWAAPKEELEKDEPQATVYMAWALTRLPMAPMIRFRHANHQKKGARKNSLVEVVQTREQVFRRMEALGKYIDTEMQATAAAKSIDDVREGPLEACRAFGGCEFLDVCPKSPHERYMGSLFGAGLPENLTIGTSRFAKPPSQGVDLMSLMDDIDKKTAPTPPGGAPAVTSAPAPAAAAPSASAKGLPIMDAKDCLKDYVVMLPGGAVGRCKGQMDGNAVFITTEGVMVELAGDEMVRDLRQDEVACGKFGLKAKGIVIRDVPTPKAETPAPAAAFKDTTPAIDPAAGVIPTDAPQDTDPSPEPQTGTEVKVAVAEVAAKPVNGVHAEAAAAIEAAKPKTSKAKSTKKAAPSADGFTLIINAASTVGEPLEGYIQAIVEGICKREGIADLRLAPKESAASFMGWRGLLAIAAKSNPPAPGFYTVTRGDMADPIIEALTPMASAVISGSVR